MADLLELIFGVAEIACTKAESDQPRTWKECIAAWGTVLVMGGWCLLTADIIFMVFDKKEPIQLARWILYGMVTLLMTVVIAGMVRANRKNKQRSESDDADAR